MNPTSPARHRNQLSLLFASLTALALAMAACDNAPDGRAENGDASSVAGTSSGGDNAGGEAGSASGGSDGAPPHVGPWKVMAFGDSITSSTCYRALLAKKLSDEQLIANVDFIGSHASGGGCGVPAYDMDNEGHGGYIGTDLLKPAGTGVRPGGADPNDLFVSDERDLATWFDDESPEIVLFHFGTNDVWNGRAPATILQAYSAILSKLRERNPSVIVLVAQIIPMAPAGCTTCATGVPALNTAITGWASDNTSAASPISVVDQYTDFDVEWTKDGVHPTDTDGSQAMADKWYAALAPLVQ